MTKKIHRIALFGLIALLAICLALGLMLGSMSDRMFSMAADADVVLNGTNEEMAKQWAQAIYRSQLTNGSTGIPTEIHVRLDANWTAENGSFHDDSVTINVDDENKTTIANAFSNGSIHVPEKTHIVLDLNGKEINRGLDENNYKTWAADGNGSVFVVEGTLEIRDDNDGSGKITGGYCYYELTQTEMQSSRFYYGFNASIKEGFGGGVYVNGENALLELYGGNITENSAATGGGVCVDNKATFNIYGGHIDKNKVAGTGEQHGGAGVAVIFGGTATMYEGSINNNEAAVKRTSGADGMGNWGGGVLVWGISRIDENNNYYDGTGAELFAHRTGQDAPSTFNMYGGTINDNLSSFAGGGVCVVGGGIRYKASNKAEGAPDNEKFYFHNNKTTEHSEQDYSFLLGTWQDTGSTTEADLNGNEADRYAIFNMNGGTISKNEAKPFEDDSGVAVYPNGGGVTLFLDSAFVLKNGEITDNFVGGRGQGTGGAVSLTQGGTNVFKMTGGKLSGNRVYGNGGAVNLSDWNDFFYMFGGEITNNYSSVESDGTNIAPRYGGGVQCSSTSTIRMSDGTDAIQIHDNYTYLPTTATDTNKTEYAKYFGKDNITYAYSEKGKAEHDGKIMVKCDVYLSGESNTIAVQNSLTANGRATQVGITMADRTSKVITANYGEYNIASGTEKDVIPGSTYFYSNNSDFPYVMNTTVSGKTEAQLVAGTDFVTATIKWQWKDKNGEWKDFVNNGNNSVNSSVGYVDGENQYQFHNVRGVTTTPIDGTTYIFAWKSNDIDVAKGISSANVVKSIAETGTISFHAFEENPNGGPAPYVTAVGQDGYIAGAGNYSFVLNVNKFKDTNVNIFICPTLSISIAKQAVSFVWDTQEEYEYNGTDVRPTARSAEEINGEYITLTTTVTNVRGVKFDEGAVIPGDYTVSLVGNAEYSNKNYAISLESTDGRSVTLVQNITVIPRRIVAVVHHTKEYDGTNSLDWTGISETKGSPNVEIYHVSGDTIGDEPDGIVNDDDVYLRFSGNYSATGVETYNFQVTATLLGKTEDISCYQLASCATSKYGEINQAKVHGEITRKKLSITEAVVEDSKEFDGNVTAKITSQGEIDKAQLVGSETVELETNAVYNSANATESTHDVKAKTITVTYTLEGANASNYTFAEIEEGHVDPLTPQTLTKTIDGTISQKKVDVTWEVKTFTYGDSDNESKLESYAYYLDVQNEPQKQYLAVEIYDGSGANPAYFINAGSYTAKLKGEQKNLDNGNYVLSEAAKSARKPTEMQKRTVQVQFNETANNASEAFGDNDKDHDERLFSAGSYYSTINSTSFVNNDDNKLAVRVLWDHNDKGGAHLYNGTYPIPGKYPIELYFTDDTTKSNYNLVITGGEFKGFDDASDTTSSYGVFTITLAQIEIATSSIQSAAYEEAGIDVGVSPEDVGLQGGMKATKENITHTKLVFNPDSENKDIAIPEDKKHDLQHVSDPGNYELTVKVTADYHQERDFVIRLAISDDTITIEFVDTKDGRYALPWTYGVAMPTSSEIIGLIDQAIAAGDLKIQIHGTNSDWGAVKEQIELYVDETGGNHDKLTGIHPAGLYSIHIKKKDGAAGYAVLENAKTYDAYGTSNINRFYVAPKNVTVQWVTESYLKDGAGADKWKNDETSGDYLSLTYKGDVFNDVFAPVIPEKEIVTPDYPSKVKDVVNVRYRVLRFVGKDALTKKQIESAAAATEDEEIDSSLWEITDGTMRNAGWYLIAYKEDRLYGTGSQNYTYDATSYLLINVGKAELTFGWDNTTVTYNTRAQAPALSANFVGTDMGAGLLDGVKLTFKSVAGDVESPVDEAKNAGTYKVGVDETSLSEVIKNNYAYTLEEGTFVIDKAEVEIAVTFEHSDKPYDGTATARITLDFEVKDLGVIGENMITFTLAFNWYAEFVTDGVADPNVSLQGGEAANKDIKHTISVDYATYKDILDNYTFKYNGEDFDLQSKHEETVKAAAKITPADVYVYGIGVGTKTYDGTKDVKEWLTDGVTYMVYKAQRTGTMEWSEGLFSQNGVQDELTLKITGAYLNKNADTTGTSVVAISAITIDPENKFANNYNLLFDKDQINISETDCDGMRSSQTRVNNLTVNKKKIYITGGFTVEDKTYNGDNVALVKYDDSENKNVNNLNDANNIEGVFLDDKVYVTIEARFGNANVKWAGGVVNSSVDNYVYGTDLTLEFTVGGEDGNLNYEMAKTPYEGAEVHAAIRPRILTIGEVTVENKVYDADIIGKIVEGTGTLFNVLADDEEIIKISLRAEFSDPDVGNAKKVTVHVEKQNAENALWNNYALSTADLATTADITPYKVQIGREIATFAREKVFDGNVDIKGVSVTFNGFAKSDGRNVELVATAAYNDVNVGDGKKITITYSISGEKAGNYLIYFDSDSEATETLTATVSDGVITPKPVTVEWEEHEFTYDATEHAEELKAIAYYNDIEGNKVYLVVTVYNEAGAELAVFKNAVNYTLKVDAVDGKCNQYGKNEEELNSNYQITESATHAYTIQKAKYYIYDVKVNEKIYDGTTNVTFAANGTVQVMGKAGTGFYEGDNITVVPHGNYRDKNVGDGNCTVLITGYDVTGTGVDNYERIEGGGSDLLIGTVIAQERQVTQNAVLSLTVTRRDLVVDGDTFSVQSKIYDGNDNAIVLYNNNQSVGFTRENGVLLDDDVTITVEARFSSANVGSYSNKASDKSPKITLAFITGGDDSSNYELLAYEGEEKAEITPYMLTISEISVASKTYDGTPTATATATLSDMLPLDKDYVKFVVTGEFGDKNVGNGKHVDIRFALQAADDCPDGYAQVYLNYTLSVATTERTADILPITLNIPEILVEGKVYDGKDVAQLKLADGEAQNVLKGTVTDGVLNGESVGWLATGVFDDVNAGERTVTATIALTGVYTTNYVINFDGVGDYDAETDKNVIERELNGVISKLKVSLHWDMYAISAVHIYNGTMLPADVYAYWHDIDGGTHYLTADVYAATPEHLREETAVLFNAGSYEVVAPLEITDPVYSVNYELENEGPDAEAPFQVITILCAELTLLGMSILPKEYDGTTDVDIASQVSGGTLAGLALGDNLTFTVTEAHYDGANVGIDRTVTLTVQLHGDEETLGNYVISDVVVPDCAITPKHVNVTWGGYELVYNGENQFGKITAIWNGGLEADAEHNTTNLLTVLPVEVVNAGTYTVKVAQLTEGNYRLAGEVDGFVSQTVTVAKARVAVDGITVADKELSQIIDSTATLDFSALVWTVAGKPEKGLYSQNGEVDDVTLNSRSVVGAYASVAIGATVVTISYNGDCLVGSDASNYEFIKNDSQHTASATILDHSWAIDNERGGWEWSDEFTAKLHIVCSGCGETYVLDGDEVEIIADETPATCTTDGNVVYTAKAAYGNFSAEYTERDQIKTIPHYNHLWIIDDNFVATNGWEWKGEPDATGANTYASAVLHLKCEHADCGEVKEITVQGDGFSYELTNTPTCVLGAGHNFTATTTQQNNGYDVFDGAADGLVTYTGHITVEKTVDPLGHDWAIDASEGDNGWTWSQNGAGWRGTLHFVCETCNAKLLVSATDNEPTTTAPDCTNGGTATYSVTVTPETARTSNGYTEYDRFTAFTEETSTHTVNTLSALGHKWQVKTWDWSDLSSGKVTLTLVCTRNDAHTHVIENIAPVKDEHNSTPAGCTEDGTNVWNAQAEYDGITFSNTYAETVPHVGHVWKVDESVGVGGFVWSADFSQVTLHLVCEHDGNHKTEVVRTLARGEITFSDKAASCTATGTRTWSATFTLFNDADNVYGELGSATYVAIKDEAIAALGHTYGEPDWSWSADHNAASATFTCTRDGCSADQLGHTMRVEATVTQTSTSASCTENGETKFTATVTSPDAKQTPYSTNVSIETAFTGHHWTSDGWTWESKTSATLHLKCSVCGAELAVTAIPTVDNVVQPDCTNGGYTVYNVTLSEQAVKDSQTTVTFTEKDNFDGITWSDSANYDQTSRTGHKWIADVAYGGDGFVWSVNHNEAVLHLVCEHNGTHTKEVLLTQMTGGVTFTDQAATCTETGTRTWIATVTLTNDADNVYDASGSKTFAATDLETLSATGHSYGEWQREEPDCTTAGRQYRECANCDSVEEVTLTPLGHDWDDWTTDVGGQSETRRCKRCDETETRMLSGETHIHSWSRPMWHWSSNYTVATATFTCTICGETHVEETRSISVSTESDRTVYKATVNFLGKAYTSQTEHLAPPVDPDNPPQPDQPLAPAEVDIGVASVSIVVQVVLLVWAAIAIRRRTRK